MTKKKAATLRERTLMLKLSDEEREAFRSTAQAAGMTTSAWIRFCCRQLCGLDGPWSGKP